MLVQTGRLLLPALFPSWRFFKEVGPSPRLEFRSPGTPWTAAFRLPARVGRVAMLGRLFRNGPWNEYLFLMSLAVRLDETGDPDIEMLLSERLAQRLWPDLKAGWQFRIVFVGAGAFREVSYESGPLAVRV